MLAIFHAQRRMVFSPRRNCWMMCCQLHHAEELTNTGTRTRPSIQPLRRRPCRIRATSRNSTRSLYCFLARCIPVRRFGLGLRSPVGGSVFHSVVF